MNTIKIRIILKDKRPLVMSSREKLQKLNKHQNSINALRPIEGGAYLKNLVLWGSFLLYSENI